MLNKNKTSKRRDAAETAARKLNEDFIHIVNVASVQSGSELLNNSITLTIDHYKYF